jgi:hypothetical protein
MSKVPLTQTEAQLVLASNAMRIAWSQPDKIIIDRTMVGGERQTATLIDILCAAYDLTIKEDIENLERVRNKIYIKPCNPI